MYKCLWILAFCLTVNCVLATDEPESLEGDKVCCGGALEQSDGEDDKRFDCLRRWPTHRYFVGCKDEVCAGSSPMFALPTTERTDGQKAKAFWMNICTKVLRFSVKTQDSLSDWVKFSLAILNTPHFYPTPSAPMSLALADKWVSLRLPLPVGVHPDSIAGYSGMLELMQPSVNSELRVVIVDGQSIFLRHVCARILMRAYANMNATETCRQVFQVCHKNFTDHSLTESFAFNASVFEHPPSSEIKCEAFLNLAHVLLRMVNSAGRGQKSMIDFCKVKLQEFDAALGGDDKRASLQQYRLNESAWVGRGRQKISWQQKTMNCLNGLLERGILQSPWWHDACGAAE